MYSQITVDERYTLGLLRRLGLRPADIARALGRHRSTIGRELRRNTRPDGGYRPAVAQERTNARRWRSRGGERFTPAEFALVTAHLRPQVESRADRRGAPADRSVGDQPRDDLSLHLGRQAARGQLHTHLRWDAEAVSQALWELRAARAASPGKRPDHRAPGGHRAAPRRRALGDRYGAGHGGSPLRR